MCGSGARSYALQACGVQLIATDNFSWQENASFWYEHPWTDIQLMDCLEAIREYGSRTDLVICSWPYMDDTCYQALLEMRRAIPVAQMLYIGEPAGGATAHPDRIATFTAVGYRYGRLQLFLPLIILQ